MRRKTHKEFIAELFKVNSDIEVLSEYINSRTKVKCRCLIDNYEWDVSPMSLLRGHGCPKCKGIVRKTHEEFIKELFLINPDITVLDTYTNSHTKISVKCNIDGYIWNPRPYSLLNGSGCPKCGKVYSMSREEFVDKIRGINNQIEIVGKYYNMNKKINVKCNIDNHVWSESPKQLLRGSILCPICRSNQQSKRQKKSHYTFVSEMKNINPNIEILGKYTSSSTKILVKCVLDDNEWMAIPNNLLRGTGCPECAKYAQNTESYGERVISDYLLSNNILFEKEKEFDNLVGLKGGKLRYDFYLPETNVLIEFDGIQHYEPIDYFGGEDVFKTQVAHDILKNKYAKKNNINLIRIPYWDVDNLTNILNKEEIKNG